MEIAIEEFKFPDLEVKNPLFIKRDDLTHPEISGNKYWKLKYNLLQAKKEKSETLVTFGGAMSNHIAATACAGFENDFKTIGVIRGDELVDKWQNNETLNRANKVYGMEFLFVSREEYRLKENSKTVSEFLSNLNNYYLVPEGGTNELAIKGASEILNKDTAYFDIITTAVGTGGTLAGISKAALNHQKAIGFIILKGDETITPTVLHYSGKNNFNINTEYHFDGYGKITKELIGFINDFYKINKIPLDPVYTGKMMFGLRDLLKKNKISSDKKILAIHTGGLQGIKEMNKKLSNKGLHISF